LHGQIQEIVAELHAFVRVVGQVAVVAVAAVLRALWYVLAVRHGAKIRAAWRIFGTKVEFSMLV